MRPNHDIDVQHPRLEGYGRGQQDGQRRAHPMRRQRCDARSDTDYHIVASIDNYSLLSSIVFRERKNVLGDDPQLDHAEAIRRGFARAWGGIGAAWGVAPSTAAVQGYLLLHGGPLTSSEIQAALGLSHRATRTAIADCETWGIVERAPLLRRGGSRGPAGTAWLPVGDHWEWFRRVAASRLERETDPILPLLDACLAEAQGAPDEPGIPQLLDRLQGLVEFTHRFDRAVEVVVRMDSADIGHLFDVMDRMPEGQLDRLLTTLARMPADDLVRTAGLLSDMTPTALHRLIGLASQPGVSKLAGITFGRGGAAKA